MKDSLIKQLSIHQPIDKTRLANDLAQVLVDVVTQSADAILIADYSGTIKFVNSAFEKISGYPLEEVIGKNPRMFQSGQHSKSFYIKMWKRLSTGQPFRSIFLNRNKSGGLFYVDQTITPLKDVAGEIMHYMTIWKDVTGQKKHEALIRHQAYHDSVTGLPNRVLLKDRMNQAISKAKRSRQHVAILFLDLDKFKNINDLYGHDVGDALLREVGQRIFNTVRESDTVSRLGGDEFVALLNDINTDVDAIRVAEAILSKLRDDFEIDGKLLTISASIGIAVFPQHGLSAEALLKKADSALYQAKEFGRNNYQLYIGD